jgi:Tat protein secretion system quality control protein TatD with DNase activity
MDTLIFSQTAIFRMQQLASCIYHKTGIRHRMATPDGMLDLLREASVSNDKEVRHYYDSFVQELNKRQLDMLAARNVMMRTPQFMSTITSIRKAG